MSLFVGIVWKIFPEYLRKNAFSRGGESRIYILFKFGFKRKFGVEEAQIGRFEYD